MTSFQAGSYHTPERNASVPAYLPLRPRLLAGASGIALAAALAAAAPAAAQTWSDGTGNWSNANNWTPNSVPNSAGASATINNGGTANVDNSFTVGTLTVGGTSGVGINNGAVLTVDNSIANAGSLTMNSAGNFTDLVLGSGTVTLNGGGMVSLSNFGQNRIYGGAPGTVLDNVDNLIAGAGEIGVTANLATLINEVKGVINANQTNALTIDGSVGITNNGLLEATNTGGLKITGGNVIDSTGGGQVQANGAGAHVDLFSATLKGGTLSTSGGGLIQTTNTGTLDGSSGAVTIASGSTLQVNNNTTLNLLGTITNKGTIADNSSGNSTDIIVKVGTVTLNGGGLFSLSNFTTNRIYGAVGGTALDNVNNTIAGAGEIGITAGLATLTNEAAGIIDANQTNALTIDGSVGIVNNGIVRATNTGGLKITNGNVIDSTGGGSVQANGAGSHIDLFSGTLKGGILSTSGGGLIETTNAGTLDGSAGAVTITSGSTVQVNNNTTLHLLGTIDAQGLIKLNSAGNLTDLVIGGGGTVTLTGPGGITTSDSGANRIYGAAPGAVLDNVNSMIGGAGEIGVTNNLTLKNESLIDANLTSALTIDSPNAVQNTGTLRASNTSLGNHGLVLQGPTIDNTGSNNAGLILATGANSHVDITNNTTIFGGTLTGTGGGIININDSTLDGSKAGAPVNITNGTTVSTGNSLSITLNGTFDNKGTLALNSAGNLTDMIIGAKGAVLQGSGVVTLSDFSANRIYSNAAGAVLENVDNTISGAGQIFQNVGMILKNDTAGIIDATGKNSLSIGTFASVTNNGLLESTAGTGGLLITGNTTIDNTGNGNAGKLVANGAGTHVDINGSTILGGTLTGQNGGVFNGNGSTLDGTTAGAPINIALGTKLNYGNATTNTLNGTINNQGTIALNSAGNLTDLVIGAKGVVLQGGGSLLLSDSSVNRIYSNTNQALVENVNNTISGAGQIFQNVGMILKNDTAGVIDATGANSLSIGSFSASPVQNTGLLETTAGTGGLVITASTTIDNTGNGNAGKLTANGAGTHVDINSSTILGGALTGLNGGVFNGNGSTLDGTTAGAPVNIAAGTTLNYANATTNHLVGTINNNGTIAQSSAGNLTDLIIDAGGVTLTGNGSLVLSNSGANRIYSNTTNTVLTNASNTISGAGTIFTNVGLSLVNDAVVDATDSTPLSLGLDITNNASGILRGSGTGGMVINAGTTTNNGTVEALNGSSVTFNGSSAISNNAGGTLTDGTWRAVSTGAGATLSLVGGTITTDAANMILDGLGSKIQAGTAGSYTDIQNTLTSVAASGQLHILNNQNYTTNTASNAIANAGLVDLGGGTFTDKSFTNTGTLSGFGKLTSTAGNPLTNSGQVIATGGNLILAPGVTGTTGSVTINNGASLDVSGAPAGGNTVGTLLHNGANLNLGSANVTVSQDYNNANFGSGNAFNNHANVTGAGSILAAGTNLSLTLSGPGITGGGTPTPTLGLGNVHVGNPLGSTFDINWSGTNAPVLRGAVQTTAGLSVSGPSYGPITPGGFATENVSVTPAGAGNLAGQSLKVVTNFDNVAPLNVTVTGAAYDLANSVVNPGTVSLGNFHVNDMVTQQALTIGNQVISNAAFQEGLNASFGGNTAGVTTSGGPITNLAAGGSSNALKVGISTAAAGAINGTTTISLASNGATTSGLGITPLASQNVTVQGGVYNLASSNVIAPLHFVAHVGDGGGSVSQALSITNTASVGAFSEGLNSNFGAYTAGIGDTITPIFTGSITNLAAGSTDKTSMTATISTSKAGLFNGGVIVKQASNGATTSLLGITPLADQNVGISGNVTGGVFVLASPQINNPPPGSPAISFGNVRINTAVANQAINVSNTANGPAGTVESLDANVVLPPPAGFKASGSFSLLAPGATDNTNLLVGLDTTTAGAHSGNVGVHFVSDGTQLAGDGTTTDLGSQNVAVSGNVYRLANPIVNTPSVTVAARVNDTLPSANVSISNSSPDAFTEGLKVSFGAAPAGFTNTGSIANLAAGGIDKNSLSVGLASTTTSGITAGTATVNFVSTGAGTDNAPDISAGSGTVALTGKVYQTATAAVSPSVDFGIVHVNDAVANKAINVANTALGALVDSVTGSIGAVSGPFTNGGGSLGAGVPAGGNSNALTVGLNTSTAGVFTGLTAGKANLALASHDADLADVVLPTPPVTLTAQVNNYAVSAFGKTSGAGSFSGGGTHYTLNLGSLLLGSGSVGASLFAANAAAGPADLLDGSFSIFSGSGFGLSGFSPFTDLAAGGQVPGLDVTFDPTSLGTFTETIDLSGIGHNTSGYSASIADVFLTLDASVVGNAPVPEPPSWAVLLAGILGLGAAARGRLRPRG